ncbi:MAG: hypothetical protein GC204_10960 [Chloroflexi bacterium]|nr:hypothetical protein [Chloroflexota bacterium]
MMRALITPALLLSALFAALLGGLHLQPPRNFASADCASVAPCWQQFQPGITNYDQTAAVFAGLGWTLQVNYCQIYVSTCDSFQWRNPQRDDQKAVVFFDQGHVVAIWFINPNVTLGDILLSFGMSNHTDEYAGFDLQGKAFTVYRSLWQTLSSEVNIDCPTTFAVLLRQPVHVLTVADPITPLDPGVALNHSFRRACLT